MIGLAILLAIALAILIALLTAILAWDMRHPPRRNAGWAIARRMAVDPGDLNLAFDAWILERPAAERSAANAAQLPVWEIQSPATASGADLTIVFVHGWGHSRIDSLARVQAFLPYCKRAVLYDLRGHGESVHCTSRLGDGEHDDLLALLERVREPSSPIVLVGHSMGAVIALHGALCSPLSEAEGNLSIAGIIAYGPYCEFHRSLIGRLRVAGYPTRPFTDLALLAHRLMGVRPLSLHEHDLKRLAFPLLVIHGMDDAVAPVEHARRIAAAAPNATLIEMDGAAHLDAHLIDETKHAQAIEQFMRALARHESRPSGSGDATADVQPLRYGRGS